MLYFGLPSPEAEEQPPPPSRFTQRILLLWKATHYEGADGWLPYGSFDPMGLRERDWLALQLVRDALAGFRRGTLMQGERAGGGGIGWR